MRVVFEIGVYDEYKGRKTGVPFRGWGFRVWGSRACDSCYGVAEF